MTILQLTAKIDEIKRSGTFLNRDDQLEERLKFVEDTFQMAESVLSNHPELNVTSAAIYAIEYAIIRYLAKLGNTATAEVYVRRYKDLLSKYVVEH